MADPVLADALYGYSPQVQSAYRHSKYLEDALKSMQDAGQNPKSVGEVGLRLLAQALTESQRKKSDTALRDALNADFTGRAQPSMDWLKTQDGAPAPQEAPQGALPPPPPISSPTMADPHQPSPGAGMTPQQRDMLARVMIGEARGEDDKGEQAVAAVAMNRAKQSGAPIDAVLGAPHQFEPWDNPHTRARLQALKPDDPQYQRAMTNIDAASQSDPTGGADHFYSPTAQAALGRKPPAWDDGSGVDMGHHRFFKQGYSLPGFTPTADQNATPAAATVSPASIMTQQAPAPMGNQGMANSPPQQSNGPTPQQIQIAKELLGNPQTYQQGIAYVQGLRQKLAEPTTYKDVQVNGVPMAYDPQHPQSIQPMFPGGLPQQAMTRDIPTPQGLPQGSLAQQSPTGQKTVVYQPPAGYEGPPTQQHAIRGGPADPTSGMNVVQNEGKLRDDYNRDISAYQNARLGYQKVVSAAKDSSGASDIAMVFGFMKTLDPNSTVREGEQATVQNSGSVPQTIMNMYNKALSGERLQPEQRAQFAQTAQHQFQVYQQQFEQTNHRYEGMARSYGFDPNRILMKQGPTENPPAQHAPQRLSPQQAAQLPKGTHFVGLDGIERVRQ